MAETTPVAGKPQYGLATVVGFAVFFIIGLITVSKDPLIPHLKGIFQLNYFQSNLIPFMFFLAYPIMGLPSARAISRFGYQGGMVLGLAVTGLGALLFVPSAIAASYGMFLVALFILASGITLLQVAINPYVASLGTPEHASSRLNLGQAINSVATTVGPLLASVLILSVAPATAEEIAKHGADWLQNYRTQILSSIKLPYTVVAVVVFLLAFLISRLKLPTLSIEKTDKTPEPPLSAVFGYRHAVLGAVGIFMYVGAEVAIGGNLYKFMTLPEIGISSDQAAARLVSLYWMGAMIGRFIGSAVLRKVNPAKALMTVSLAAILAVAVGMFTTGPVAMWTLIAVGLFNAIMFPTIFALGIAGMGSLTGKTSALISMAIVGGALVPIALGAVADIPSVGLQKAFFVAAICYAYIAYYGASGYKPLKTVVPIAS
ncbi:MAG TPA: sugar MFS transporter [Bryobacteraceae bacterium]|nr:sugar MFS transporter [Bryobacteraceae bacterium]